MKAILGDDELRGESLALPRFLAMILFLLAAVVALPAALVLAVALARADWRGLGIVAVMAPVAAGLGWLGSVLWSGRSIPLWFMRAFGLFMLIVPVAGIATRGDRAEVAVMLAVLLPMVLPFAAALRGRPSKPKPFDDFR